MNDNDKIRHIVFPIVASIVWGISFVAQDVCVGRIDAFTLNAARSFIAAAVLFVVYLIFSCLKRRKSDSAEKESINYRIALLGGLCCGTVLAVAANFQQFGMVSGTDAGKAAFITALYVVLVPVLGLLFKRKVSLNMWIAVILSVAALYLLCMKPGIGFETGDLLVLVCAFCYAIHILTVDYFVKYVDGVLLSCIQFLVCGIWSLICAIVWGEPSWSAISSCILPILYLGVFSSGVGYTLQILSQKGANPAVVTILLSLESVFAVIFSALIIGERMSAREYAGCILMLIAVILAQISFPSLLGKKESLNN